MRSSRRNLSPVLKPTGDFFFNGFGIDVILFYFKFSGLKLSQKKYIDMIKEQTVSFYIISTRVTSLYFPLY